LVLVRYMRLLRDTTRAPVTSRPIATSIATATSRVGDASPGGPPVGGNPLGAVTGVLVGAIGGGTTSPECGAVGVGAGGGVGIEVGVGVSVAVGTGVAVGDGVSVGEGVSVGVTVGASVGVGVSVGVGIGVGVSVGAGVGVGVSVGTGVGEGVGVGVSVDAGPSSKDPMSHAAPCGRETPRWSAEGHESVSPLSMAGLPAESAWVRVGPPLSASEPSCGSVVEMSPVPVSPQLPSESRLCPMDVAVVPAQSVPPVLFATIVFLSDAVEKL